MKLLYTSSSTGTEDNDMTETCMNVTIQYTAHYLCYFVSNAPISKYCPTYPHPETLGGGDLTEEYVPVQRHLTAN